MMSKFLLRKSPEGSHGQRALLIVGMKGSANGNAKPTENCCSYLLDDECSNFRCGDNYGGAGIITVLNVSALRVNAYIWIPIVVIVSLILAAPIAWLIAPRLPKGGLASSTARSL